MLGFDCRFRPDRAGGWRCGTERARKTTADGRSTGEARVRVNRRSRPPAHLLGFATGPSWLVEPPLDRALGRPGLLARRRRRHERGANQLGAGARAHPRGCAPACGSATPRSGFRPPSSPGCPPAASAALDLGRTGRRQPRASKRSCTAVATLLTFCPPGPLGRMKLFLQARGPGISTRGVDAQSLPSAMTVGPCVHILATDRDLRRQAALDSAENSASQRCRIPRITKFDSRRANTEVPAVAGASSFMSAGREGQAPTDRSLRRERDARRRLHHRAVDMGLELLEVAAEHVRRAWRPARRRRPCRPRSSADRGSRRPRPRPRPEPRSRNWGPCGTRRPSASRPARRRAAPASP